MSRSKKSNDVRTREKGVRVGRRIVKDGKPVALVGPEQNLDTISAGEFARQLYGPGYQFLAIPPEGPPIMI